MLYWIAVEKQLQDDRIVLSDGVRELTFYDIHCMVAQYAGAFQSMGIKRGERIIVTEGEPLETVFIFMTCIAMGYIFVPVSCQLDQTTYMEILDDCRPALVLDSRNLPRFMKQEMSGGMQLVNSRQWCPVETLVYIIYTSGSEGMPKGVVASQKQIFFCTRAINKRIGNTKSDRILCSLPLSFDYGLYQIFLAFFSGAVLYVACSDILQSIPYLLREWKITAFPTIPTVANLLWKTGGLDYMEGMRLRYVSFTGEVLSLELIKGLRQACPDVRIIPMYGVTECKRVSIMPEGREDKMEAGSCGIAIEGVRVYLISKNEETGIGELVVEGDNVMEGYWGKRLEQSKRFFVNPQNGKKAFYTGDLFRIDEEGFLFFCGRKNNIIKIKGMRVSSAWIENKINAIDDVIETAVFGVEDLITGEHLEIFVYSKVKESEEKVIQCMRQLPKYLHNYQLHMFTEPLPKNQNGKIDLRKLRQVLKEGQ